METRRYDLWQEGEYSYPLAYGFRPNLRSYLHDEDDKVRPCMMVIPGGSYRVVSPTEGEIVAKAFFEMGYQAFVCTYTTNLLDAPLKGQPLRDVSRAVRFLRRHAAEFRIDPEKVVACGFSAGGHLCASLCVHFDEAPETNGEYAGFSNRADAAILSYPVITSGPFAHRDSFTALLGGDATPEELEHASLETQVTERTTPCFVWQTATDELVPVENSYLIAEALKAHGVPFAHHVFSGGPHGLSLSNETWANGEYGEPYTLEQTIAVAERIRNGSIPLPEAQKEEVLSAFGSPENPFPPTEPNEEVRVWPVLAAQWLKGVLGLS